ncbi:MAG: hypothetical protein E6K81_12410 [Candidatus Eisenbacteria bacterium]|uniref:Uncharacterized protein n=1 Tax=Eiseniibacteriota bacterium TaxID=2212470 RepID=A0A538U3P1_UNCEI|nr:MAG: hypothetical protein E6K81_12410 [Candidatus Eisenbacteria bacterium]
MFPLLVCLLCSNGEEVEMKATRSRRRLRRAVAGVLIGASITTQSVGAANHIRIQGEKAISLSRMASLPGDYVLTNVWWVPQEAALAILRAGKVVLLVDTEDDLAYAIEQLERAGAKAFTFVGPQLLGSQPPQWGRYREVLASHFILNPFDLHVFEFLERDSLAARAGATVTPTP